MHSGARVAGGGGDRVSCAGPLRVQSYLAIRAEASASGLNESSFITRAGKLLLHATHVRQEPLLGYATIFDPED